MFARPFIDSIDFAENGRELCGEIPVVALSRLQDLLADTSGILRYKIRGAQEQDRHYLDLQLNGECRLCCQRCLAEFSYPVETVTRLQLLAADELDVFDAGDREVDVVEASAHLDVNTLIEDEMLLELPFAPKHPDGACSSASEGLQRSANPFAALASLKKKS